MCIRGPAPSVDKLPSDDSRWTAVGRQTSQPRARTRRSRDWRAQPRRGPGASIASTGVAIGLRRRGVEASVGCGPASSGVERGRQRAASSLKPLQGLGREMVARGGILVETRRKKEAAKLAAARGPVPRPLPTTVHCLGLGWPRSAVNPRLFLYFWAVCYVIDGFHFSSFPRPAQIPQLRLLRIVSTHLPQSPRSSPRRTRRSRWMRSTTALGFSTERCLPQQWLLVHDLAGRSGASKRASEPGNVGTTGC